MKKDEIRALRDRIQDDLFNSVVPFWERVCYDERYGGIRHIAARDGTLYSAVKGGWFQGRGTWTFARLYNDFGRKPAHLEIARSGYRFMVEHCFDHDGRMFFELKEDGTPLRKRRYWFGETFAVMGMAEYARASGDEEALQRARDLYARMIAYYRYPGLLAPKYMPGSVDIKSHNTYMSLISSTQVLRDADPANEASYNAFLDELIAVLLRDFVKPERQALFECVTSSGQLIDSPAGRRINPGHSIETCWFLLMEAKRRGDAELMRAACQVIHWSMKLGWDETYGGLFNYIDIDGMPCEKVEWDMKYWWTHCEGLNGALFAYRYTGDPLMEAHVKKLFTYTYSHFPDPEYGEWYGYLHRDGSVCLDAKGTLFKGPFHVPRALMYELQLLDEMAQEHSQICRQEVGV